MIDIDMLILIGALFVVATAAFALGRHERPEPTLPVLGIGIPITCEIAHAGRAFKVELLPLHITADVDGMTVALQDRESYERQRRFER